MSDQNSDNNKDIIDKIVEDAFDNFNKPNPVDSITRKQLLSKDLFYVHAMIGEIVECSQQVEELLRICLLAYDSADEGKNLWKSTSGNLLKVMMNKNIFSMLQIEVLKKIIELRNWVMHEYYIQKQVYIKNKLQEQRAINLNNTNNKTNKANQTNDIDMSGWVEFSNPKLLVTKNLLLEAIGFIKEKIQMSNV